ncbi:right-handed parallel beta-helix repeat-containing protein [Streptomyces sp. NTH33]|uniref:right-handed parallel beta-helix repeat-containing protein n=1 Tax=Streptomyces sp. NTH33 TaxID=1735453 RepID=UPI000DAA7B61|nr:right-handed parallel beta-helix repeat-containing protein [Streptomyces sp. NTH33]PZH18752.1 right-handed parallel beta-helix repeat-containing protein [Streptomyces sp. NTH33]
MTLYTFGGNPAAVLTDTAGNVIPNYPVNVRRAGSGELVTALFEADGTTPIGELRSNPATSSQPGAIRTFTIPDVRAIEYQYLDAHGNPVTWYEAAREIAPTALDASSAATAVAEDAQAVAAAAHTAAAAAQAAADAAQGTADQALMNAGMPGWYVVTGAARDGSTDDYAALQAALDAARPAGGGTVLIPPGRYATAKALTVYDNTVIYAYGATIKAIGGGGLLHNYANTSEAWNGYNGRSNITVAGGTWDGNAGTGPGQTSGLHDVMSFNHCRNITVRDVTILNTSQAHALEFNAVDGGRAINCRFLGFADLSPGGTRQSSEAVQIDIAVSGSSPVGAFDGTPSKNIEIIGCYCGPSDRLGAFGRFVGSHTIAAGTYYDNITVRGNVVEGTLAEGIRGYGWRRAVIEGNIIRNTAKAGIVLTVPNPSAGYSLNPDQIVVSGNVVDGAASESGIRVMGYATAQHSGVRITGNTVNGRGSGSANGIQVECCKGPGVTGNSIEATGSTGVYVNQCTDALVSGCTVTASGSNGINLTDSPGGAVTGNTITGTAANHGITVGGGGDSLISNNHIAGAASAGIRLSTNAVRCTVTGNKIRKAGGTVATVNGISAHTSATGAVIAGNDLTGNGWTAAVALLVTGTGAVLDWAGGTASPGHNRI